MAVKQKILFITFLFICEIGIKIGFLFKMDFKTLKKMLRKVLLITFTAAVVACSASPKLKDQKLVDGVQNIQPSEQQRLVCREVITLIENYNYKKIKFNDSISSIILDKYIKTIDPSKMYFLANDIKEFEQYRTTLDDDIRNGDLSGPFYIFNLYLKRYNNFIDYAIKQLNVKYDFTKNDTYVYGREKLPWVSSTTALNDLWGKRVKYELLMLKVSGSDNEAKNIEILTKRYQNLKFQAAKYNNQDVFQLFMNALTESVDPHTNYYNPRSAEVFNAEMSRSLEGIGATLQVDNEVIKVVSLIPGGPAFKSKKINAGDRIVGVAQGANGEFEDLIGWRIDDAIAKIKGPKGTVVRLKIIPVGKELSSKPVIITLVREKVILADQSAKKTVKSLGVDGKTYKMGIIFVPVFYADFKAANMGDPNYKSTTRDVKLLIDTLKNMDKVDAIVIDLRLNGGGSLLEAISLTGLFIDKGPVVQVRDKRSVEVQSDKDLGMAWSGPLGVMVDRISASASEIFAAAIQDYGRGIIMGSKTYGKGTVQSTIDLTSMINPSLLNRLIAMIKEDDKNKNADTSANKLNKATVTLTDKEGKPLLGQLNLTTAKFYRINGNSTQHKGVIPDIIFPSVYTFDKIGEDTEPAALPFDMIQPSAYVPVANLSSIKQGLVKMHQQRMAKSLEYKFLEENIAESKKRHAETAVTLNEDKLKAEFNQAEMKALVRTNQLREERGLAPLKKEDKKTREKEEETDFVRDECLRIMVDFMKLSQANKITFSPKN